MYFTSTLLFQVLATGNLCQDLAQESISVVMSTTDEKLDELKELCASAVSALREGQEDNRRIVKKLEEEVAIQLTTDELEHLELSTNRDQLLLNDFISINKQLLDCRYMLNRFIILSQDWCCICQYLL